MNVTVGMARGLAALGALAALVLLGPAAATAAPTIAFTLDGKGVDAVPVDRLGDVKVEVRAGAANFKALYSGQWSGLDQTCSLVATGFPKGGQPPRYDGGAWGRYALARTGDDSGWGSKSRLGATLFEAGKGDGLALFKASTEHDVVFSTVFRRHVYTGKEIWVDGKKEKETAWEQAGSPQGQAVLKLQPPTVAGSLDQASHFGAAVGHANAAQGGASESVALRMAKAILYPTSYGGRKVDFAGSKVLEFAAVRGAGVVYNWNYVSADDSQKVQARFPVKVRVQAAMSTRFDGLDRPVEANDTFTCDAHLVVDHAIGRGGAWKLNDIEIGPLFADSCKTEDGRTAAAVAATVKHPAEGLKDVDLDESRSKEDRARDILKTLGIPEE